LTRLTLGVLHAYDGASWALTCTRVASKKPRYAYRDCTV